MLVITKSMAGVLSRPKYHPKDSNAEWCVRDTALKRKVFGPACRDACNTYIDQVRKDGLIPDRKSTRLNSRNTDITRMPASA